jgi:hypothetical protein
VDAAAEADRQRIAQAQAAIQAAETAAQTPKPAAPVGVDALALAQQARIADTAAWEEAQRIGTLVSYRSYVSTYPNGAQVSAARTEIEKLSRPAAFSVDQVSGDVKTAVEAARRAQTSANTRAQAARTAAASAETAPNVRSIVAADGDRYDAQISSGAPNGLGTRVSGDTANTGDRYRGELRNGQTSGVGVYEFADNPANAQAGALRYEGEHASDRASGFGITYWRNGDTFAGQTSPSGPSRGVLSFANGQRYEGELENGERNGLGVVWGTDGTVLMAGRWSKGELVEPMPKPAAP